MSRFRESLRRHVMSLRPHEAMMLDDIICKLRDGQPTVVQPRFQLTEGEREFLARFSLRVVEMKNSRSKHG